MNILLAGLDTAGMLRNTQRGLRTLGINAFSILIGAKNIYYDNTFDLQCDRLSFTEKMGVKDGQPFCVPTKLFYKLAAQYDVFMFMTSTTLLPGMLDLPILREMGKTVLVRHTGSDVRHYCPGSLLYNARGIEYALGGNEADLIAGQIQASAAPEFFLGDIVYDPRFGAKLHTCLMSSLYATAIQAGSALATLMLRPFHAGINTFDATGITPHIPGRPRPLIVHAPTSTMKKGTTAILDTLKRLEAEGVPFDLVTPRKIPNSELKKLLLDADIVVDQIGCGGHGILGNESMAAGCMVLGSNDPLAHPIPLRRPVVPIRRDTLYEQLKRAVLDLPFRRRAAECGVAYIASGLHSNENAARYSLQCLERAKTNDFDYYPTLFADNPYWPDSLGWIRRTGAVFHSDSDRLLFTGIKEPLPEFVTAMVARCVGRFGLHPDTDLPRLCASGLLGTLRGKPFVKRWDTSRLTPAHPWLHLGPHAVYGMDAAQAIPHAELDPFPVTPLHNPVSGLSPDESPSKSPEISARTA